MFINFPHVKYSEKKKKRVPRRVNTLAAWGTDPLVRYKCKKMDGAWHLT